MKKYLTAQEAASELGITPATLYAYVSRGLIRSEAAEDDPRARRYDAQDVQALKARRESRHSPERIAENALHLGTPVLESGITLIEGSRLYYRGHDVVELAQRHSIEQVAALIWAGSLEAGIPALAETVELPPVCRTVAVQITKLSPFERFQVLLPLAAAYDVAAYDLRPQAVAQTGARILRLLTGIAVGRDKISRSIAGMIQTAWAADRLEATHLLDAALILCADHELNVSAFTARCAASANSTPYAVVSAGMAALQGSRHGGHTERVEAFLREAGTPEGVYEAMAGRLKRGEKIPGFGHALYPDYDPRAAELLRWVADLYPNSTAFAFGQAATEAAQQLIGEHPTVDMGLVILCRALNLPAGSPIALFAIARSIGWIGHAIEQYQIERMIRPRARYIGEKPEWGNQTGKDKT